VSGDLGSADGSISGYSCSLADTGDKDDIFSFVAPASGQVTVNLDVSDSGALIPDDFDLYLLAGGCHPGRCVAVSAASGDDSATFAVTAGTTYYIVVEAYEWGFLTSNGYTVQLEINLPCWGTRRATSKAREGRILVVCNRRATQTVALDRVPGGKLILISLLTPGRSRRAGARGLGARPRAPRSSRDGAPRPATAG
jgi:hypothetical protein